MTGNDKISIQMAGPVFSTGVETIISAVTTMGIIANGISACKIWGTFPHKKVAIFFLVLMDSIICCIGSILYLATFLFAGYYRNQSICTLQNGFRIIQIYTGTMITLEIAISRYMKDDMQKIPSSFLFLQVCHCLQVPDLDPCLREACFQSKPLSLHSVFGTSLLQASVDADF